MSDQIIAKHNNNKVVDKTYCLQSAVNFLGGAKDLTPGPAMEAKVKLALAWMELSKHLDYEGHPVDY